MQIYTFLRFYATFLHQTFKGQTFKVDTEVKNHSREFNFCHHGVSKHVSGHPKRHMCLRLTEWPTAKKNTEMAKTPDIELAQSLRDPLTREQAFRTLMKEYGHSLYWHIRRIVVSHDDAEDALQETAIKVYQNAHKFKGESRLSTWLYRIATNEALLVLRSHTRLFQSIDSLGDTLAARLTAENDVDSNSAETLMQKALLTLPTQQRIAFNLRYYDDLPYEEIARITGKSEGTLKTNYHYATERIRKYLNDNSL